MARQSPGSRPINENAFEDEVDLMELLHFLAKSTRYWVLGGLLAGLLGLVYALTLYPTYRQQTINDIGLNHEQLNLIREIMQTMMTPIKEIMMRAQGLDDLYKRIMKNPDYLDKTIIGISGADLKNCKIDKELENKIDTISILIKGKDKKIMQREMEFIKNNIRDISNFLEIKKYLDKEASNADLQLFNAESN